MRRPSPSRYVSAVEPEEQCERAGGAAQPSYREANGRASHGTADRTQDVAHSRDDSRLRLLRARAQSCVRGARPRPSRGLLGLALRTDGSDLRRARDRDVLQLRTRLRAPRDGRRLGERHARGIARPRRDATGDALRRILGPDVAESPDVEEAAGLARLAAEAASAHLSGKPLFAGHASLPWPDDPVLALWHAQTLLREFRGDIHIAAMTAAGIDGCEALVTHAATGEMTREILQGSRCLVGRPVGRGGRVVASQGPPRLRRLVHGSRRRVPAAGRRPDRCRRARGVRRAGRRGLHATPVPLPSAVPDDRRGGSVHRAEVVGNRRRPRHHRRSGLSPTRFGAAVSLRLVRRGRALLRRTAIPETALHMTAQGASRNGVINASTSPGRRVMPTCVVPGSTASCAFGRSSNISTTSDNGEKSRSPKISRVGGLE